MFDIHINLLGFSGYLMYTKKILLSTVSVSVDHRTSSGFVPYTALIDLFL